MTEPKDLLRKLRKEYKFAQKDIAQLIGVERSTYSNYELGKTTPSYETLRHFKRIFKVSLDYLLDYDNYIKEKKTRKGSVASVADNNPMKGLSKDEIMLLACYRVVKEEDKSTVVEMVKRFTIEQNKPSGEDEKPTPETEDNK